MVTLSDFPGCQGLGNLGQNDPSYWVDGDQAEVSRIKKDNHVLTASPSGKKFPRSGLVHFPGFR